MRNKSARKMEIYSIQKMGKLGENGGKWVILNPTDHTVALDDQCSLFQILFHFPGYFR